MGKVTVGVVGTIKVKMDTPDDIYYDAKDPHVSLEGRGGEVIVNHLYLSTIDNTVGDNSYPYFKEAVKWVRKHRWKLEDMYKAGNPYRIYDD